MKITKIDKKDIPQIRPIREELNKHHGTDDLKSIKKATGTIGLDEKTESSHKTLSCMGRRSRVGTERSDLF